MSNTAEARRTPPRQCSCARLLSLDYFIERQTLRWLPTEADKVQRFEALGIDRAVFPYRKYGTDGQPKIRQELARLDAAIRGGNRHFLRDAGGWEQASDRFLQLSQLPEGTPTKTTARGVIDRFSVWSTIRLISPEAAT